MKSKKNLLIQSIYTIHLEEPDDYYLHPRGVLFVDEKYNLILFCSDVDHNFLLKVIRKFPFSDLEKGLEYNRYQFELKNLTKDMVEKYGESSKIIPEVLNELFKTNPRQYSFLSRFLNQNSIHPHVAP